MPLDHYGVLVGTLQSSHRDQPDNQGRWFHVNLELDAPLGRYRCAVDVDSKQSDVGVAWRTLTVQPSAIFPVPVVPGYHELASQPGTGAVDYIRHPALKRTLGCVFVQRPDGWLAKVLAWLDFRQRWKFGSNLDAATALESILQVGRTTYVFGEPFSSGLGMHNVHQNQGDPAGSQWWAENGTWQDGATMVDRPDGMLDVFLSKFSSQSDTTDANGHPI
jgi:hypothetical protein